MTFNRFEKSLKEQRTYIDDAAIRQDKMYWPKLSENIQIRELDVRRTELTGTHVMSRGHENPRAVLKASLGVDFPNDFCEFYQHWNGGILLLGLPYRLLSVQEIIATNKERIAQLDPRAPYHWFRFAYIHTNDYVGFYLGPKGSFVAYLSAEYSETNGDTEIDEIGKITPDVGLAPSFSEWLTKVLDNDGYLERSYWKPYLERAK